MPAHRIHFVDSHTAGEPTRVVISGGPDLGAGPVADRLHRFRSAHDAFRSAIVNEPRGSDVLVGALLCAPTDPTCAAAAIFFNNVGYLGMCGHGTIGLAVLLAHLGRITAGDHRIETPVGIVKATLHSANRVTVENVPAYRLRAAVEVAVPGYGPVRGDIAWGGNWFFLVSDHNLALDPSNIPALTAFTSAIKNALRDQRITGSNGAEIDHVELFTHSHASADSQNFVLCPGNAYDRSPCGTGTSAKLACLFADGKLKPGQIWRQAGILGTIFEGSVELRGDLIIPRITGSAFITGEGDLLIDPADPFAWGIRA
jgi:4-hydroxyproline epimerase